MEGDEEEGEAIVECYAGYRYPERPLAFEWAGGRYRVDEVEREWKEPGLYLFVVRDKEGARFQLSYSEVEDCWRVRRLQPARGPT